MVFAKGKMEDGIRKRDILRELGPLHAPSVSSSSLSSSHLILCKVIPRMFLWSLNRTSSTIKKSAWPQTRRWMATIRSSVPHEDRTAAEPRENRLQPVILSNIREVNESVRLLRLSAAEPNHVIKVRFASKCRHMNSY